jgi:hypothetical protein
VRLASWSLQRSSERLKGGSASHQANIPLLEGVYSHVFAIISFGSGLCLFCSAHFNIYIKKYQAQNLGLSG